MMMFPYHFIIELIGVLLSAIFFFQKSEYSYLKYFSPFLLLSLGVEMLGWNLRAQRINTLFLYNFFTAFEFVFYLWVIRKVIQSAVIKKALYYILFIYPFLAIINIVFIQKINHFHTLTYAIGCLLIIFFCIYYFFELFRVQHSIRLSSEPAFWICSALLFFYSCTFPLFVATNLLLNIPDVISRNASFILTLLNVLLYSLFIIAFLCKIKTRKLSSSLQ